MAITDVWRSIKQENEFKTLKNSAKKFVEKSFSFLFITVSVVQLMFPTEKQKVHTTNEHNKWSSERSDCIR